MRQKTSRHSSDEKPRTEWSVDKVEDALRLLESCRSKWQDQLLQRLIPISCPRAISFRGIGGSIFCVGSELVHSLVLDECGPAPLPVRLLTGAPRRCQAIRAT